MTRYLITGANRGLGLEFTRQLLERGDAVAACCREPVKALALHELQAATGTADRLTIHALDVTDPEAIRALPAALRQDGVSVDVLINNAGIAAPQERFGQFGAATMTRVMTVNAMAPMLLSQAVAPLLDGKGGTPKIVCITSELGSISMAQGLSFGLSYGMSKAALNMGVKKLGQEMRRHGVVIVALHPGWVRTDMGGKNAALRPAESIRGMLRVIDDLTVRDNGRYLDYRGKDLPW